MRGHGFVAAARSLIEVVRLSVYLPRNARALTAALMLGGEIKPLSPGEIERGTRRPIARIAPATWRAWEILGERVRLRTHGDQAGRGGSRKGRGSCDRSFRRLTYPPGLPQSASLVRGDDVQAVARLNRTPRMNGFGKRTPARSMPAYVRRNVRTSSCDARNAVIASLSRGDVRGRIARGAFDLRRALTGGRDTLRTTHRRDQAVRPHAARGDR